MGNFVSCFYFLQNEPEKNICSLCERRDDECICGHVGSCSCPQNGEPLPSCVFYSPRIQGLHGGKKTELETTQEHWTKVDSKTATEVERVCQENRKYFDKVLVKHPKWGVFFSRYGDLEVGDKVGEGGQAEIFAATTSQNVDVSIVLKVFKKNVLLKDLEQQWPPRMLYAVAQGGYGYPFENVMGGVFIREGEFKNRFGFVMKRQWGDLRTLLDQRMLELLQSNNHGPPFSDYKIVCCILWGASFDLKKMHRIGILHRDIKASNLLLRTSNLTGSDYPDLTDFECSLGVLGTGFWRAPEILEQVQRKVPSHEVVYSKKADIYSFGMLCYEIITGRIPFEGHSQIDYSIVLRGERPRLPEDLDPRVEKLMSDCWKHDPQERPSARRVHRRVRKLVSSHIILEGTID